MFQLVFTWIARCLMQINSCVNPFIYATILSEVKMLVREKIYGKGLGTRTTKSSKPANTTSGGQTTFDGIQLNKLNNKSPNPSTIVGKESMIETEL